MALKLRGLDDAALKAHANYRYYEFFSRKAVEYRLYKQLQRDVPTFEIWKDQGFSHITKAVDLKQIVNTMEFKFYERYVKAFHQKVKGDLNAWRDPTAVMVARGATEADDRENSHFGQLRNERRLCKGVAGYGKMSVY
ncbi:hypothetical protein PI126_g18671 [Phytophthora idaei]|nr:hypothetical protein PI126_g18671 [Phytophthora idaei]